MPKYSPKQNKTHAQRLVLHIIRGNYGSSAGMWKVISRGWGACGRRTGRAQHVQ